MAWAVKFGTEFGRFFPCGDYPEWLERLHTYFTQEMPTEEKEFFGYEAGYHTWVFEKFTKEIGYLRPGDRAVRTLPRDHEWPRTFHAERKIRSLGSIIRSTNRLLFVDEAMKNLIEGLEPGIHQFRPLTFLQPNSEIFPGPYFTMIIGQFRDSFIPEPETEGELWKRLSYIGSDKVERFTGSYRCDAVSDKSFARLSFSSAAIGGAHLWRERWLLGPELYISDALHDAIKKAKLKMPLQFKVREA